jgi:D-alanine-D-alanine ligase
VTIHPEDIRVAVLMGGRSAEREVSLNTGTQVSAALESAGFDVVTIDTGDDEFVATLAGTRADVAFICLHGRFGEDGTVQGLCELLELPYIGSGVLASALAMDKVKTKVLYAAAGLPTPEHAVLHRHEAYDTQELIDRMGEDLVVKPANEGSSVGLEIVHDHADLAEAIERVFRHDRTILVERFVAGTEATAGVLGNEDLVALPVLEIVPEHEFYDYESKYVPGMSRHFPARLPTETCKRCAELAIAAHNALGCRGISRTDFIVEDDGTVWILETNTIPGMTSTSLVPDAARSAGIEFPEFCRTLVELALSPRR